MTTRYASLLLLVGVACTSALVACRRSCCPPSGGGGHVAPPSAQTPSTFSHQAERGSGIYANACAQCHGADGKGTKGAPALVGPMALPGTPPADRGLRTMAFRTVGDVQRFVKAAMPPKGARLSDAEAWAVVAFALAANGVTPPAPLSSENGDTLPLGR